MSPAVIRTIHYRCSFAATILDSTDEYTTKALELVQDGDSASSSSNLVGRGISLSDPGALTDGGLTVEGTLLK